MASYFESKGIHHEKMNAYTPQENGVAEQMNHTIVEMARTFLQDASLPNMYWSFGVNYATYVINWTPTCTLKEPITPFEAYTGNKLSVTHLRIFGCKGYVHVLHEKHQKLDKKTLECTYLGYSEHKKAFILVHLSSGRIVESWDVHFDKSELVEHTRVRIETEISQNEEEMENLPVKRKKQAESDSDSSVDFQEPPDGESDDDNDGYDSETSFEGYGTAGSSGSNARPSTAPDNDENCNNRSKTVCRAMPTSQTKSATSKTPKMTVTHLRNMENPPTNSYQVPSVQPEEQELHCSTRI